jgi:hypothetical protein
MKDTQDRSMLDIISPNLIQINSNNIWLVFTKDRIYNN